MNPKAIHELSLGDIIHGMKSIPKVISNVGDVVSDSISKSDSKRNQNLDANYVAKATSIARASTGLIFTYPVLCSTSLTAKSCMKVGSALERKNVTMLQILLAACQRTNQNIMEYIKNFHTNLDFDKMTLDDFVNIVTETAYYSGITGTPQALMEMMPLKEKSYALEDFRENTNYFFKEDINNKPVSTFTSLIREGNNIVIEANNNPPGPYDDADDKNKIYSPNVDTQRLISSEVKKANEMVPSLMLINTIDPSNGVNMQSVIGVKSRLISVPSGEITGRLISHFEDSNALLKFVKLTTREISFIKDFLLAIDSAKLDAINNSKKGSATSLFKALERRSQNGKVRKLSKSEKQFAKAIASIVISQEDVENLKKEFNIDVEEPRVIIPIMTKLNLLYFVIVDEDAEVVKIFVDGGDDYEQYTFSALEKESKDDGYKKVINLMTKMTR